jgi:hypothetical protein
MGIHTADVYYDIEIATTNTRPNDVSHVEFDGPRGEEFTLTLKGAAKADKDKKGPLHFLFRVLANDAATLLVGTKPYIEITPVGSHTDITETIDVLKIDGKGK